MRLTLLHVARALRELKREPLGFAVIGVSVAGHLFALALLGRASPEPPQFALEARLLIALSLAASVVGAFLSDRLQFRVVLYVRCAAILIVLRILSGHGWESGFLALLLFFVDAAIYEPSRPAVIAVAVSAVTAASAELIFGAGRPPVELLLAGARVLLGAVVVGGAFVLVTRYREKLLVDERAIEDLNKAFERIAHSNLDLQSYAANAEMVSASEERSRITRELHDSVGYAMTNIVATMNASEILIRDRELEKLSTLIANARETARRCLGETRATLYLLRSIPTAPASGLTMLAHLARVFSDATGVSLAMEYGDAAQSYGQAVDETIYRFVQEGLTNAFRHAKSSGLRIRVMLHEHEGCIVVRVWDNGQGMQGAEEGIGLTGMRERVERLGGRLSYADLTDGFEICAELPAGKETTDGADTGAPR